MLLLPAEVRLPPTSSHSVLPEVPHPGGYGRPLRGGDGGGGGDPRADGAVDVVVGVDPVGRGHVATGVAEGEEADAVVLEDGGGGGAAGGEAGAGGGVAAVAAASTSIAKVYRVVRGKVEGEARRGATGRLLSPLNAQGGWSCS